MLFVDRGVEAFLSERGELLPADEHNLLSQWALAGPSVYEVLAVRPGESVALRDLRSGDEVLVTERTASKRLEVHEFVFAHPCFDGTGHQFLGALVPIPLRLRDRLMELLDNEGIAEEVGELLGSLRRPPQLANSEGERLVACQASFRVQRAATLRRKLDGLLEPDGEGSWVWLADGSAQRVLRGMITLEGNELRLSANSEERLARLREHLAGLLESAELIGEEHLPAGAGRGARGDSRRRSPRPPLSSESSPEAMAALEEMIEEAEARWVDEPVPALAGLTPRAAAADPTRREQLIALLREFDRMPSPPGARSFDTGRLRARLGIEEGSGGEEPSRRGVDSPP